MLDQLQKSLHNSKTAFSSSKTPEHNTLIFFKNPKNWQEKMALFISNLSKETERYQTALNQSSTFNSKQEAYQYFKESVDDHLRVMEAEPDLTQTNSVSYLFYYALAAVMIAFFGLFDYLVTGVKRAFVACTESLEQGVKVTTMHHRVEKEPYFKLPKALLNKEVVKLSDEFKSKMEALNHMYAIYDKAINTFNTSTKMDSLYAEYEEVSLTQPSY